MEGKLVGSESEIKIPNYTLTPVQFNGLFRHVTGKMLTILEATISDERQLKATKDLVKQTLWRMQSDTITWYMSQGDGKASSFPFPVVINQ